MPFPTEQEPTHGHSARPHSNHTRMLLLLRWLAVGGTANEWCHYAQKGLPVPQISLPEEVLRML
jgi:hypothetical protein